MIKHLWRWHPEVALRYLPIVKKIYSLGLSEKAILEIGSGSLGIAPYIGKPITGVDLNFEGPQIDLLTKVRGSITRLPILNKSFDTVLMVDVLEHLSQDKREKAIFEAVRVSKKLLVIASPTGKLSQKEDKFLANYYQKVYQNQFSFYQEHLKFGLPEEAFIGETVAKGAKKFKREIIIEKKGNLNISLHRFLMMGWMTKNKFIDIIFRKVFLILIPLFMLINCEPTYRKIFFIKFRK